MDKADSKGTIEMFETGTLVIIGVVTLIALGVGITGTARVMTGRKPPENKDS